MYPPKAACLKMATFFTALKKIAELLQHGKCVSSFQPFATQRERYDNNNGAELVTLYA